MPTKEEFIKELSKIRQGSTFLNIEGYRSSNMELANYNIIFNFSYENALKRSFAILNSYIPETALQAQAQQDLLKSWNNSLSKIDDNEIDSTYTQLINAEGSPIKGLKMHNETGTLYLYGLVHQKIVIEPGVYKKVNHQPLTIEKNNLSKLVPVSKFRQFKILPDQVKKIKVDNLSFLPPEN